MFGDDNGNGGLSAGSGLVVHELMIHFPAVLRAVAGRLDGDDDKDDRFPAASYA